MELIRIFGELGRHDAGIAGGKGASLGEMTQAGIPVPPGFVVLSSAFERFLKETDLNVEIDSILHGVDTKAMHTIEHASETIQKLILEATMPEDIKVLIQTSFQELGTTFVAVRSSATAEDSASAAWAGQLDSFLNTTETTLLENVQRCWASLFTPRAIFYRFEQGLHDSKISVAVVVQKMVESEVSGIAFSVHPVTEDRNQLIIEAGFGLGEAIVSGSVTPDSYVVEKEPRKILDINVSTQTRALYRVGEAGGNEWRDIPEPKASSQVLTEAQILELSELIIHIENHYGFPCDIEWAYEVGKFYIVQSRPITTLTPLSVNQSIEIDPEKYKFFGLWKCNLFADWYWTQWLVPELSKKIGLNLDDGGVLVIQGGNFFVKKETISTVRQYVKNLIESKNREKLLTLRTLADDIYFSSLKKSAELKDQSPSTDTVREMAEAGRRIMFTWCFGYLLSEVIDEFIIDEANAGGVRPEDISSLIPQFHTPLFEAQENLRTLKNLLERNGYWELLLVDAEKALEAIGRDSEVQTAIEEYSKKYGWTAMINLVGEDPTVAEVVDQITHLPPQNEKQTGVQQLSESLTFVVEVASAIAYLRQTGVEYFSMYSRDARTLLKKTATQLNISYKELLDLNLDEILSGIEGGDVREIVSRRANDTWAIHSVVNGEPKVIDDTEMVNQLVSTMIPKADTGNHESITGQIGNKGVARGRVKVVISGEDFSKMEKGDVLVTTMTTPDFVPLMQKASAIVTNIGGLLCHAAIISRELNTPCIIGTKFATEILKDGDLVEVDADNGVVRVLEKRAGTLLDTLHEQLTVLEKMFAREKSLMYMMMWAISERIGYVDFIDYKIQHSLFSFDTTTGKTSVWYSPEESEMIHKLLFKKVQEDGAFIDTIIERLDTTWKKVYPYLSGEQTLCTVDELKEYYNNITYWWSAMNTVYPLINNPDVSKEAGEIFLKYRENSERFTGQMDTVMTTFCRKILQPSHKALVEFLLIDEVIALVRGEALGKKLEEISERTKGYVIYSERVSTDPVAVILELNNLFFKKNNDSQADEIVGTTAFSGIVRGRVQRILNKKDIEAFKEGSVLVAETTFPDHVPAMKKAVAFVTDEGGITCHAAIAARELKKPCIIGTKIATQVLKDGDLVEVDADNGVVRVLERVKREIPIYEKIFSRDFCLPLVEVWCRAESTDPRIWTEKQQPKTPYIIFEKNGDVVNCYMDNTGIEWVKQELSELVSKDPGYVQLASDKFIESVESMSSVWERDEISDLDELKAYLKSLRSAWVWFEAVWWLMELFHDNEEQIKKLMPTRLATEKIGDGSDTLIKDSLRTIFPHLDDLVDYLLADEIESGNIPDCVELEKRKGGYVYTNARLFVGGSMKDIESEFRISVSRDSVESLREKHHLNGKSAYRGLVRGKVRIILSKKQIPSLEEGEVLVASMTTPDYLPALQKAIAFVTDEGGITCHAAIIARELKKPCIIGTKIATQVLKDGDLVEVDADNGVVRVLERANEVTETKDGNREVVKKIILTNWHSDWSGPFSLFGLSLPTSTYFGGMEKYFGKGLAHMFLVFKDGIVFSRLPEDEYHELGHHLVERAQDIEFVRTWARQFKEASDAVISRIPESTEDFIKKIPELLPYYQAYAAHSVATKIAFDVGFKQLSTEACDLFEDARKYSETFYKDDSERVAKAIQYIADETGYSYDEVYMLTYDEYLTYKEVGTLPSQDVLRDRWVACGIHFTRDKITFLSADEVAEVEQSRIKDADSRLITGQTAYKGVVRGRCKIVLNFNDATFNEGEVLVTGMTDPHYVPLMKKASAIITDGGGMLSHAAIVARELKTPCVVGTKYATQILKDGDLVEVDADNGVVRVLERK